MITVLRLGERPERDHRINTHLALVARAFGAERMIMAFRDPALISSISGIGERFGGDFNVEIIESAGWRKLMKTWNGIIVHLTMYGQSLKEGIASIRSYEMDPDHPDVHLPDILIVVGGEKVPAEVYQRSTFNIAVGNQPHSEVAALAVFLDRLLDGDGLDREMAGWKHRIIPTERGKRSESRSD
jgi:tRNA (cytidine56-2'-O)-methyltransferase